MLLMFTPISDHLPLTVINIHNGEPMLNCTYKTKAGQIEFIEQFNNKLMVKVKDDSLKITDMLSHKSKQIHNF